MMKIFSTITVLAAFVLVLSVIKVCGSNSSHSTLRNDAVKDDKFFFQPMTGLQASANAPVITSSSRTTEAYSYLLSWKPNAILTDIKCYKIRYKKEYEESWNYTTVPANATQLRLGELDSSSLYEVEMRRLSRDNETSQLAMSSFRTGTARKKNTNSTSGVPHRFPLSPVENKKSNKSSSAKVPGAPSKPFVTRKSATSVSLTWLPRSNGGSPITGYKVQVRIGRKRSRWKTKTSLRADTKSYDITGLKRDILYKFRVIATNSVGDSSPSPAAIKIAESDPELSVPPLIRDVELLNGTLLIHWTYENIDPTEFQGFIVKYTVGSKRKRDRIKDPHVSTYEITSIVHAADYSVKIQAYNGKKVSPESDPIKFNVIRDHAKKKDVINFSGSFHVGYENNNRVNDYAGDSSYIPSYNDGVKENSSRRDLAIVIVASVVFLVIIVLLSSCVFYHKQKKKGKRKRRTGRTEKEPSTLCVKLFGTWCYREESEPPPNAPLPSSAPRCSCYSGASSPLRTNGSCVTSNRTSMSHNAAPDNSLVPCSRVQGNMYAVYYDYSPGRPPPPCLATPGVPLCWVRGEGEFCHIIPHSTRPKMIDEAVPSLSGAGSMRSGSLRSESMRSGSVRTGSARTGTSKSVTPASTASPANEPEVDPEQVRLVERDPEHAEET